MPLPIVRHLIVCERIVPPSAGRNFSIENIIFTLNVRAGTAKPAFPRIHPKMSLFTALTGREPHRFAVDLVYWKEGVEVKVVSKSLSVVINLGADPLAVQVLPIPMDNTVFPASGDYEFVLLCDGMEIGHVPIHLREVQ